MLKIVRNIALVVVALIVAAGIWVVASGNLRIVAALLTGPKMAFDPAEQGAAPDYADEANWAALPTTDDLADLTPQGVAKRMAAADVDVFFIHPTGYLAARRWTSPMDPASATEENTKWMMANQASVFNGCCDVYAPRYREAAIHVYVGDRVRRDMILDFAYADVERAFDYFLEHHSQGRPFIIASHSQGSYHAMKLLEERIDGTDLRTRMVAAYVLGAAGDVTAARVSQLQTIRPCDAETDLNCVMHLAAFADGSGAAKGKLSDGAPLCTNPLSWRNDGARAEASLHRGYVPPSGVFSFDVMGGDAATGVVFGPLGAPEPELTFAECRDGKLIVANLSKVITEPGAAPGSGNYHGLDYPLFAMDLRANAIARADTWLAQRAAGQADPVSPAP